MSYYCHEAQFHKLMPVDNCTKIHIHLAHTFIVVLSPTTLLAFNIAVDPKLYLTPQVSTFSQYKIQETITHYNIKLYPPGQTNMKPARPWMLVHLKIIWQFHAHPVHQKVSRFFEPRYIGDDFFLGPNLVSFNRADVPLFELSFLTKSQKLTSA